MSRPPEPGAAGQPSVTDARLVAERYALLVTNLPASAVMMFDHDLRFVLADGPELERNGRSKHLLEGKLLYDAVDRDFAALVEPNLRAALAGHRFHAELPFGELEYLYTYEPLRDDSGAVVYALVVAQNVTALRQAERSAQQNEARIRELMGNVPGVVFAIGADRRFRFSDGLALGRLGFAPGELDGRVVDDVYGEQRELLRHIDRALGGQRLSADITTDGAIWEFRFTPILTGAGAVSEVLAVGFEVTERRRAEASTLQAQKMEAVGRLAGGIAHDFNNMLAVMMSAAEELGASLPDRPDLLESSTLIVNAATRASQLTRQLLAFARNKPLSAAPVLVDDIVREAFGLLSRSVDRRIRVISELGAPGAVAVIDAAQLQTALINLGLNARDAMPNGGELTLSTAVVRLEHALPDAHGGTVAPGEYIRVSVSDTGVGIPAEDLARIFDPFFTTKDIGQGTGLGLAVVYGTARAHGSSVTVESVPAKGTRFDWFLPLSTLTVVQEHQTPGVGPSSTGRVLLVEDEPLVQRVNRRLFETLGFDVVCASEGQEALTLFAQQHDTIDLVLCDMVMPGMSGLDVVRRMRAIDPSVPVAMCSGYSSEALDVPDGELPEMITKPFRRADVEALLVRLANHPGSDV
ncbi:MAG: response regulator [Vicinamibacterales bacterium]